MKTPPIKRLKKKLYFQFLKTFMNEIYTHGIKDSMFFSIEEIKRRGFIPRTVIDVGAYTGGWTSRVVNTYPEARFIMLEAQPEKKARLDEICNKNSNIEYRISLLGSEEKPGVPYYLMETGSSVLEENTGYDREITELPMHTLDNIINPDTIEKPCFLKLDVQGYEIEVLKGAGKLMQNTDIILLEVSILEYNKGAPLLAEVIQFMDNNGFSVFDITDLKRTTTDRALFQADIFFCRQDHSFITNHNFS